MPKQMPPMEIAVTRPQRWDVPFGETMREENVDALLKIEPFASIDAKRFPAALPLRGILQNDTRIGNYQPDNIIVREGDYGHSAFLILQGKVRVVLEGLNPENLGRQPPEKQGTWQSLMRMWKNPRLPEVRHSKAWQQGLTNPPQAGSDHPSVADLAQTRVFLQDVPRLLEGTRSVTLHAGEIFGELAALTRSPRSATVLADGEVLLLEIRWQGLRDLMRRTDALRQHIEQLYRKNSLRVHLRETPLFAQLPTQPLEAVAAATSFETHGNFEWHATFKSPTAAPPQDAIVHEPLIVEEGSPCDGLVLIRSGFARLSHRYGHGHRTVAYLGKGQVFGLTEAIKSFETRQPEVHQNSLRALGYVDVLRIPQAVMNQHVFPAVPASQLAEVAQKHAVHGSPHHGNLHTRSIGEEQGRVQPDLLEFLVERRLINGTEAMLIDLDRCTRCDDCVRACAATHDNNPRFIRHGPHHGSTMVANACMHCVDPVCMIGCPTGAIGRDQETGVVRINDLTCVGCSTCANSCPYDNIRMAEVRDASGAIVLDESTQQPLHKATKCDLCADRPSLPTRLSTRCACPHGPG